MKKILVLALAFQLSILVVTSQVTRKRYFRDSKVFMMLPVTFIQGTSSTLNDFTQDKPNILILLTVNTGAYDQQVDKMLRKLSHPYLMGTKDQVVKDIVHQGLSAKYVTFDQLISEGLPWSRHHHLIFGSGNLTYEIMAIYDKDIQLESKVESYLLSCGIDE